MNIAQLKTIKQNFVKELQEANAGRKTSLPFIVHKLSSVPIVKDGEIFQVMVIGGSIFKKAFCKKIRDRILILKKEIEKPLTFRTENDFLRFIDTEITKEVNVLAINFAYPLKPVFEKGKLDGVLLAVTKEGGFHGLVGKKIGEEIERYIFERRKKIMVSVANDTICLLLSGLSKYPRNKLAAGIVGTGFNIAFFLDKEKAVNPAPFWCGVNLESANFDKFPQSKEGKLIDRQSAKPGKALFEKETAGAYLYKHFNIIIKEKKIDYPQISSTEELNEISLERNYSSSEAPLRGAESRSLKDDSSRQAQTITNPKVSQITRYLLKRSAQLVACQIAGIVEFKKGCHPGDQAIRRSLTETPESVSWRFWTSQNDKEDSMVFNMEGSLFWKGNNYKETVRETVGKLVPEYKVRFVEIKDSAILGAAKLVA